MSLWLTVSVPDCGPGGVVAKGANVTVTVVLPGLEGLPPETVPVAGDALYSELLEAIENVNVAGPLFLMANVRVLALPATTVPKARLDVDSSILGLFGSVVPVTVTGTGVTAPSELVPLTVIVALWVTGEPLGLVPATNLIWKVLLGGTCWPVGGLRTWKCAGSDEVMLPIVTGRSPVELIVKVLVDDPPSSTSPKAWLVGLTAIDAVKL